MGTKKDKNKGHNISNQLYILWVVYLYRSFSYLFIEIFLLTLKLLHFKLIYDAHSWDLSANNILKLFK